MKYLLLAAALSVGFAGASLAQTSTPNPQSQEKPATSPNGPGGPTASGAQGMAKPCNSNSQASGTSDREGGNAKAATDSGGSNSNPNGMVQGGC
jgi:hypothetical protein